jgi:hypothetical protein
MGEVESDTFRGGDGDAAAAAGRRVDGVSSKRELRVEVLA